MSLTLCWYAYDFCTSFLFLLYLYESLNFKTKTKNLHGRQSSGGRPKSNEQWLSRMNTTSKIMGDATPFFIRFEQGQCCSLEPAESVGVHPGYLVPGNTVDVAETADGDKPRAASFRCVGTRSFVFTPGTFSVEVTQKVLLKIRPVRHRAVPRAVGKLLGQRRAVMKGEPQSLSSLNL